MHDADRLLAEVTAEARAAGIPVSASIDPRVRINRRATTRFGCCILQNGRFIIELSERLLDAPEAACRETLAHELLHTCRGCRNHGARWKDYAARMNERYGYTVARTASCEALGVADTRQLRYWLRCEQCGARIGRSRRSALIRQPERYRCRCGGRLVLTENGDS